MVAREIKMRTHEMGDLRATVISERSGVWEEEWRPLQGTVFEDLFTRIPMQTLDEALKGWTKPFVQALRITPEGALKKIPEESRVCIKRHKCPFYEERKCFPEAKQMPWCFEPDGVDSEVVRQQATRAIDHWRNRIYLVVVQENV